MNGSAPPLVSIVTPVYNCGDYLVRCIESVRSQTYTNWEYIIVNNCSTDRSAEIALEYTREDPRIRLYENKEFLRVIPNHNSAIRMISSESKYCKMVFADDLLFPECLEKMVGLAELHPSVGIVGSYGLRGSNVIWTGLPYPQQVFIGAEMCRRLFLDRLYVFGTPHSLLYRADLVRGRNPFFNESNLHADSEVCCALLKGCDFGFIHQVLTVTTERPESLLQFSFDLNTLIAGKLYELVVYGRDYLNSEEYESCVNKRVAEYYRFLANSVGSRTDKRFWQFHRQKLAAARIEYSRFRLFSALLGRIIGGLMCPKETAARLGRRFARHL